MLNLGQIYNSGYGYKNFIIELKIVKMRMKNQTFT